MKDHKADLDILGSRLLRIVRHSMVGRNTLHRHFA